METTPAPKVSLAALGRKKKPRSMGEGSYAKIFTYVQNGVDTGNVIKKFASPIGCGTGASIREHSLMRDIKHPFLISSTTVHEGKYGIGDDPNDGGLHIVMEKATSDLQSAIKTGKFKEGLGLNHGKVKKILAQILLGMEYLHHNSIVHRDITSSNILYFEEADCVKICDYGTWSHEFCLSDGDYTNSTYRCPELYTNSQYDSKVDIWSAGMALYEILCGNDILGFQNGLTGNDDDPYKRAEFLLAISPFIPEDITVWAKSIALSEKWMGSRMNIANASKKCDELLARHKVLKSRDDPLFGRSVPAMYSDILKKLLTWYPKNRPTATEILDDPFFNDVRPMILSTRAEYLQKNIVFSDTIRIPEPAKRTLVKEMLNNWKILDNDYFSKESVLHAVHLFYDLLARESQDKNRDDAVDFLACLIIAYKYSLTNESNDDIRPSMKELPHMASMINSAYKREIEIMKIFEFDVGRTTFWSAISSVHRNGMIYLDDDLTLQFLGVCFGSQRGEYSTVSFVQKYAVKSK